MYFALLLYITSRDYNEGRSPEPLLVCISKVTKWGNFIDSGNELNTENGMISPLHDLGTPLRLT